MAVTTCACGRDVPDGGTVVGIFGNPPRTWILPCCGECDLSRYYPNPFAFMSHEDYRNLRPHLARELQFVYALVTEDEGGAVSPQGAQVDADQGRAGDEKAGRDDGT